MSEFLKRFRVLDGLIIIAICLAVYLAVRYFSKPTLALIPASVMEPQDDDSVNKLLKTNNTVVKVDTLRGKDNTLRAAAHNKEHVLLNQADVKDKKNYICNKECPCDERTVGESLDDIRKQFLSPTESFYGNVTKTSGVALDAAFVLGDGKEHNCTVKPMDKALINGVLGCKADFIKMNNNGDNKVVNANAPVLV
jgi:hypothetical protein